MKKLIRTLALLLTALMLFSAIGISAYAEESPTHNFVIEKTVAGETEGGHDKYEFLLYQMFIGDVVKEGDNYVLSNITWGNGVKEDAKAEVYTWAGLTGNDQTAENVAKKLASVGTASFHSLMIYLGGNSGMHLDHPKTLEYGSYAVGSEVVKGYGAGELVPGYYLVRNTRVPSESETYSDYIVVVLGEDLKAQPKAKAGPSTEKKVQDINDSDATQTLSALQDSADYDIGDKVPYTLTATLPDNYGDYTGYKLVFWDDMCAGLTFDGKAKIYFGAADTA